MLDSGVGPATVARGGGRKEAVLLEELKRFRGVINYTTLLVFLLNFLLMMLNHMRSTNVPTGAFLL